MSPAKIIGMASRQELRSGLAPEREAELLAAFRSKG